MISSFKTLNVTIEVAPKLHLGYGISTLTAMTKHDHKIHYMDKNIHTYGNLG
jgi:hypothetical protein